MERMDLPLSITTDMDAIDIQYEDGKIFVWRKVKNSSNVTSLLYSGKDGVLRVGFKGNSVYNYKDVPPSIAVDIARTNDTEGLSVGKFLNKYVKGVYEHERVI